MSFCWITCNLKAPTRLQRLSKNIDQIMFNSLEQTGSSSNCRALVTYPQKIGCYTYRRTTTGVYSWLSDSVERAPSNRKTNQNCGSKHFILLNTKLPYSNMIYELIWSFTTIIIAQVFLYTLPALLMTFFVCKGPNWSICKTIPETWVALTSNTSA